MEAPTLFDRLSRLIPGGGGGLSGIVLLGLVGMGVLIVLLIVLLAIYRFLIPKPPPKGPAQEKGVGIEDLAELASPPPQGSLVLTVEGAPVRLRLVVVAPVAKSHHFGEEVVPDLLDAFLRGLGEIARQDVPEVRIWPPQLSHQGFATTFQRMMRRPEPEGKPSPWVLLAGQTPPRPKPLLLGLALEAAHPNSIGRVTVPPEKWSEMLRIQTR
jgi:hypothetical protein